MKRIFIAVLLMTAFIGCRQGNGSKPGPKETLETFYRNLCSGEMATAQSLCAEDAMGGYLDRFRTRWEMNDSTVRKIASDIMTDISVDVTDSQQEGQNITIFYRLTATGGLNKEKIATLKKEEGEWKITAITDRH